jgi:hypothetical protein
MIKQSVIVIRKTAADPVERIRDPSDKTLPLADLLGITTGLPFAGPLPPPWLVVVLLHPPPPE